MDGVESEMRDHAEGDAEENLAEGVVAVEEGAVQRGEGTGEDEGLEEENEAGDECGDSG